MFGCKATYGERDVICYVKTVEYIATSLFCLTRELVLFDAYKWTDGLWDRANLMCSPLGLRMYLKMCVGDRKRRGRKIPWKVMCVKEM